MKRLTGAEIREMVNASVGFHARRGGRTHPRLHALMVELATAHYAGCTPTDALLDDFCRRLCGAMGVQYA